MKVKLLLKAESVACRITGEKVEFAAVEIVSSRASDGYARTRPLSIP